MATRPTRVLLVDDDFGFLFPLSRLLGSRGYVVLTASDVDGLRRHYADADVVVVDARLPTGELEGIAAVAEIRRSTPETEWKPIVFMSIHEREECSERLSTLPGQSKWIVKPFEIDLLISTIDEVFREQQARTNHGHDEGRRP